MKRTRSSTNIFWGIIFIFSAILIILDALGTGLGFLDGIPVIKIIIGVLLFSWVITNLIKLKIADIFFPLAFIFMLFESNIAKYMQLENENIISNWLLLLSALLLTIGVSAIFPSRSGFRVTVNNSGVSSKKKVMGSYTRYIDCTNFVRDEIEVNMSSCEVFFENTENYTDGGVIEVDNNMGSLVLHIPADWHIICDIDNHLGAVQMPSSGNTSGKKLYIRGDNNMGRVRIVFAD